MQKSPFLVLPRSAIMLQHLIIQSQFTLYYLSSGPGLEINFFVREPAGE